MIRLLGVLVGSALAVTALVVFVGIPQVQTESPVALIVDEDFVRTPEHPDPDPVSAAEPEFGSAWEFEEPVETAAAEPVSGTAEVAEDVQQWYSFWSPFRTEIAASGFVTQLQRVTGLDYRVVRIKTGVYEIAVAYRDDAELVANLAQIAAATGLQLPER